MIWMILVQWMILVVWMMEMDHQEVGFCFKGSQGHLIKMTNSKYIIPNNKYPKNHDKFRWWKHTSLPSGIMPPGTEQSTITGFFSIEEKKIKKKLIKETKCVLEQSNQLLVLLQIIIIIMIKIISMIDHDHHHQSEPSSSPPPLPSFTH